MKQKREAIYDVLHKFGPLTSHEINRQFVGLSRQAQPNVPVHIKEMITSGLIRQVGTLRCSVTGMNVVSFDVARKAPKAS